MSCEILNYDSELGGKGDLQNGIQCEFKLANFEIGKSSVCYKQPPTDGRVVVVS